MRIKYETPTEQDLADLGQTKEAYKLEIALIQNWFKETDWMNNKITTHEWTESDPRWVEYMTERAVKRARQDELNTLLESLN